MLTNTAVSIYGNNYTAVGTILGLGLFLWALSVWWKKRGKLTDMAKLLYFLLIALVPGFGPVLALLMLSWESMGFKQPYHQMNTTKHSTHSKHPSSHRHLSSQH